MVLDEGWDLPEVACCILARPTRKMGLYRQMVGRVLRPADGKVNAIVLDHTGAVFRHGFVEDLVEWTLDPEKRSVSPTHTKRLELGYSLAPARMQPMRLDPGCRRDVPALRIPAAAAAQAHRVQQTATWRWSTATAAPASTSRTPTSACAGTPMLAHIAIERGYKPGWAAHKFKEKFGTWPATRTAQPIEPSPEVLSWVRSRIIAYAKAKERAA